MLRLKCWLDGSDGLAEVRCMVTLVVSVLLLLWGVMLRLKCRLDDSDGLAEVRCMVALVVSVWLADGFGDDAVGGDGCTNVIIVVDVGRI